MSHHELRSPKSKAFDDPRFVEWLAREARVEQARGPDRDALSPDEIRSLARRIQARVHAERFGVRNDGIAVSVMQEQPSRPVSRFVEEFRGTNRAAVLSLGVAAGVGRELWDAPVDSWVQIPDDLPHGRYLALTVSGDSMSPLMHTGDTVLVRLGPDVTPDTVIVALVPDHGYVVKCVGRVAAQHRARVTQSRVRADSGRAGAKYRARHRGAAMVWA
jgi:SOS-response transcriptional repressor LexA